MTHSSAALGAFGLHGKLALVTGATSGLGQHFAGVLTQAGARVVLAARRLDRLTHMAQALNASGYTAYATEMDVSDADSVVRAFDRIAEWGVADIVVNNAGVTITKPALQQTVADFDSVMDTNLRGAWLVATEAARRLVQASRGGCVVNVASILAERVAGGVAPYAVSKAGVLQLTKALALELARNGIRVNALLPGYIATDLNKEFLESEAGGKLRARIPSRRFGELSDLDGPLLLLASDAGAAMSGAALAVDGAHLVSSL